MFVICVETSDLAHTSSVIASQIIKQKQYSFILLSAEVDSKEYKLNTSSCTSN